MFTSLKKVLIASVIALAVLLSGGRQSNYVVMAKSYSTNVPETPLYTGLTWNDMGMVTQEIRINTNGDTSSLLGERYEAKEKFIAGLPKDVLDYYSNTQLAKSGWVSYDAFEKSNGIHYVFFHEAGMYLSVEFLKCPDAPLSTCISIWKSEQSKNVIVSSADISEQKQSAATGSFGKKSPANGATNLDPKSVVLSWNAYTPEPDNYSYCVKEGSACSANDPEWTNTWGKTSVTLTNLSYDKTYYWQVKARVCVTCVPQTLVYADNGTVWTFKTHPPTHGIIMGNAGVSGAVLSYMDITPKTITADNYGSYLITIPLGWSGMVTPAKPGYLFSPKNASFTNLTALQTIQNFNAVPSHLISGNVSVLGATLSYTYGTPQNVMSNNNGSYSIELPDGWSGTVTPTHPCYTFSPTSLSYSNVTTNQTAQNYTATFNPASGCASIDVTIGGNVQGSYALPSGKERREYYPVSGGPVIVKSTNGMDIVSAIRLQSFASNTLYSFVETMGVPEGLLSHKYYFPTYNNTWGPLNSQVRFGNLNDTATTIRVTIGGVNVWEESVPGLEERRLYFNVSGGPVVIESLDPAKKIVAAIRLQSMTPSGTLYSFAETMGIPDEELSHKYYFPTYNNTWGPLNSQVRFGNLNDTATTIRVTIGGVNVWEESVPGLEERRLYFNVSGGPVVIESLDPTKKIVAAIRLQSMTAEGTLYSFVETMGVPEGLLSHKYYFPTYDNTWGPLNSQIRFGNLDATQTRIRVTIGGNIVWEDDVPGLEERRLYFNVSGGPVKVESLDPAKKIVAAIRLQSMTPSGTLYSFAETMGVPDEQLSGTYYFPTYNNTWGPLNSQLRFGVP